MLDIQKTDISSNLTIHCCQCSLKGIREDIDPLSVVTSNRAAEMMISAVMKQESERFMVLRHLGWESSSIIHLSWSMHLSPIQVKFDLIF